MAGNPAREDSTAQGFKNISIVHRKFFLIFTPEHSRESSFRLTQPHVSPCATLLYWIIQYVNLSILKKAWGDNQIVPVTFLVP